MSDAEVDRLYVKLTTNYQDFLRELKKAESGISKATKELGEMEGASNLVKDGLDDAGSSTEKAAQKARAFSVESKNLTAVLGQQGNQTKNASEQINNLSQSAEDARLNVQTLGNATEKTGRESGNAAGEILGLENAVDNIKGKFSALAIAGTISMVADQLVTLQDQAFTTARAFENVYSSTTDAAKSLDNYYRGVKEIYGVSADDAGTISEAVGKSFSLTGERQLQLSQAIADVQSQTGISGSSLAYSLDEIANKWNIPDSEVLTLLNKASGAAATSPGDYSENLSGILSGLKEYDMLMRDMGYSLDETLSIFLSLRSDYKDIHESMSLITREYNAKSADIAAAPAKIAAATNDLKAADSERLKITSNYNNALSVLYDELSKATSSGDMDAINAEILQLKNTYMEDIADLDASIVVLRANIAELSSLFNQSSGYLTRELVESNSSKSNLFSQVTGKDREEVYSIISQFKQASNYAYAPSSYGDKYGDTYDMSAMEQFSKASEIVLAGIKQMFTRTPDALADARAEYSDLMTIIREEGGIPRLSSYTADFNQYIKRTGWDAYSYDDQIKLNEYTRGWIENARELNNSTKESAKLMMEATREVDDLVSEWTTDQLLQIDKKQAELQRMEDSVRKNPVVLNITQNISAPVYDSAAVEQAARTAFMRQAQNSYFHM